MIIMMQIMGENQFINMKYFGAIALKSCETYMYVFENPESIMILIISVFHSTLSST